MSISPIDEHDDRPPVPRRNHDAIHLAPCSCELHVRIRELEAELAIKKRTAWAESWKARAEKAELEIASCPNKYWHKSVKLRGLVI